MYERTDKQTERQTDTLIATFPTPYNGRSNTDKYRR